MIGSGAPPQKGLNAEFAPNAQMMLDEGRKTFDYDTFWGDVLQLHEAIAGEKSGGVGPGVSPETALSDSLKVDSDAVPDNLKKELKRRRVNLDDPATTSAQRHRRELARPGPWRAWRDADDIGTDNLSLSSVRFTPDS